MKRLLLISFFILQTCLMVKADSLWIEADAKGQVGKPQTVKVIFGSYNQYRLQKVTTDDFQQIKDFTCWAISPSGKHVNLMFRPKVTAYEAVFTPDEDGTYVLLVENKLRRVEDWSNSSTKIGVAKQHYYGRTTVTVGSGQKNVSANALTDLTLVKMPCSAQDTTVSIQVLLHGKPVPNATLFMRHPEMPEQKLTTAQDGKVSFTAPKPGRYFALVTLKFDSPGTYRGVHYDVFREKSTLTMVL